MKDPLEVKQKDVDDDHHHHHDHHHHDDVENFKKLAKTSNTLSKSKSKSKK